MYSLLIVVLVLVGIHYSYKYLERRSVFVANVLESQLKERYDEMVSDLSPKRVSDSKNTSKEDEDIRKEELDSFLEELKQNPTSETNVKTIS